MEILSERLRQALSIRNMKQSELSELTGIGKSSISTYLSGEYEPKQRNIYKICKALNVNEAWLMGKDVPITRTDFTSTAPTLTKLLPLPETRKIPLLGSIACGTPILAEGNIEDYLEADVGIKADFCLRCQGDSMINARIFDGDIVYIHVQPEVENGEIAAVRIDDDATLKRVRLFDDHIILQAENPTYAPLVFWGEEMNGVEIIGKAVAFTGVVV